MNMTLKLIGIVIVILSMFSCGEKPVSKSKIADASLNSLKLDPTLKRVKPKNIEQEVSVPKEQLDKAKALIAATSDETLSGIDAKAKFKMVCANCHGFKGDMNVNGAKDLTISKLPLAESVAQIYFGKGLMTPFRGLLKDAEIIAVAQYAKSLRK